MKLLSIIFAILLIGCSSNAEKGQRERIVNFKNGLGQLRISLPQTLDTSYQWTSFSDYKCGHRELFRFSDRDFSQHKESGFFYSIDQTDSIFQVTISQPKYLECHVSNDSMKAILDRFIEGALAENPNKRFSIKEVRKIDRRSFAIMGSSDKIDDRNNVVLSATTVVMGQVVSIVFNCYSKQELISIEEMYESMNTIKITANNKT